MEPNPRIGPETQYFCSYPEEEVGDSTEKSTKMGYVLEKGLSLGKKIMVTGFVVSSVPLLLPPLLVVSALGFTFSLPFGFYYASYACTEKLMSKLLPTQVMMDSANVPLLLEGDSEPEEVKKTATSEEIRGFEGLEEDVETNLPFVGGNGDELMEKESEKSEVNRKSVGAENPEDLGKKHGDGVRGDVTGLEESEKGGRKGIWRKLKPSRKRKAHSGGDKKVEDCSQESKVSSSDIVSSEVVAEDNTANERVETPREEEQATARDCIESKGTGTGVGSLESSTEVGEVKVAEEGEGEEEEEEEEEEEVALPLKEISEYDEQSKIGLSDERKHSLDEAALVDMPELKNEETQHLERDRTVSDSESVEGPSDDEKIWRKIDLIRAIVGFKTPRHPSYIKELKELYAFTGIEWPPSAEEPSGLSEFNNKLRFLMSVIGVK
ncbi:hypothetical protein F511_35102 [Dorcoceras hygrometricum]|uniref:Uncharacterized protein n=1 Tax=Dorcoceras hygrometricum TaxID=472368 RepID=A0A2Z7D7J3_9LAMI|nr:hypothetical protein F511_35102 [Dorcoceras hygrometricum]